MSWRFCARTNRQETAIAQLGRPRSPAVDPMILLGQAFLSKYRDLRPVTPKVTGSSLVGAANDRGR